MKKILLKIKMEDKLKFKIKKFLQEAIKTKRSAGKNSWIIILRLKRVIFHCGKKRKIGSSIILWHYYKVSIRTGGELKIHLKWSTQKNKNSIFILSSYKPICIKELEFMK